MTLGLAGIDIAVLCGGKGSRIEPVLGDLPKALAPVSQSAAGPVTYLDWLLAKLKRHGATGVTLLAGIHAEQIASHLARNTPVLPVRIHIEAQQEGTANALRKAAKFLKSDPVLVINGDTLTDADLGAFRTKHDEVSIAASVLFAKPAVDHRPEHRRGALHAGFTLVPKWLFDCLLRSTERDFDAAIGHRMVHLALGDIRFLDIGTPERLAYAPVFFDQIVPAPE